MKLERESKNTLYELAGAHISSMHYKKGKLTLDFADGFLDVKTQHSVRGSLYFEAIDPAESDVMVYKLKKDKVKGKLYDIKKFTKKYQDEDLEIINEFYDPYNNARLEGVIQLEDQYKYFVMELATIGHIYYLLDSVDDEPLKDEASDLDQETADVSAELDSLAEELDGYEESRNELPWDQRVLVKNTTFDQRKKIVEDSLGGDVTCAGDDVIAEMYNDYIDGKMELADINKAYMKMMTGEE